MRILDPTRKPVSLLFLILAVTGSAAFGQNQLIVNSAHGTCDPPVGANNYPGPSNLVVCSVLDSPWVDTNNTRYVCTGWTGTGSVPPSGTGTNVTFWLDQNSAITWQWKTQYLFSATAGNSNGTVSAANGWKDVGAIVSATATPITNFLFSGWFGDVPSGRQLDNPLSNLLMDQPRVITAFFGRNMYVSQTGGAVAPYATWATAANTIEDALAIAGPDMTILVSNGTYNIAAQIELTNSVTVRGAAGPSAVTVQPVGAGRCFLLTAGSSVEGMTITGGDVSAGGAGYTDGWGGGVLLDGGGTVSNCIVTGNVAQKGGGIHCYDGGTVEGTVVSQNTAWDGSARHGGGIFVESNATIRSCLIVHNLADFGGGVSCSEGGVLWNCTVASNTVTLQGGGVFLESGGQVRNSILYYNEAPLFPDSRNYHNFGGGMKYYTCCLTPGVASVYNGGNNITVAPQFVAAAGNDFSLLNTSPCIDTGANSSWMDTAYDVTGTNRILNATVDRGAYEFVPPMIRSWSGENGTVTPNGTYTLVSYTNGIRTVSLSYSNNLTYNIAAALYYRVADVVVDGMSIGPTNSYTFTGVTNDHTIYATFVLNRPTLIVSSLYGATIPAVGTNEYEAGSSLLCMILDTEGVTNGTTRYMFTGWTGTGDVPASGTGSSFGMTINNDSTLTWGWKTQYLFTATSSSSNGIVSPSNLWCDAGSSNTVTATPAPGYRFAGWTGDVPATNANDNPLTVAMDQARSVTGNFEIIRVTLTVISTIDGTPSPAVGVYTNDWGTSVTCSMANVTVPVPPDTGGYGTRYVCTAWVGTGDIPAGGTVGAWPSVPSVPAVLTTNSIITWQWKTQYRLTTSSSDMSKGVPIPLLFAPIGAWYDAGSLVQITPIPASPGSNTVYRFAYWSGDVPSIDIYDDPLWVMMDQARDVTAHFDYVPRVMYVSPAGSHTFPFETWGTAATNVSIAVNAGGLGSEIYVGDGTYTLSSSVQMDDYISLTSINGAGSTIIDGAGTFRCINLTHANAIVDGFTIRNGSSDKGAGVRITDGGTVRNCTLENNDASNRGGGAYIEYDGMLSHCIVMHNTATNYGAGVAMKSGGLTRNCLVIRNGSLLAPTAAGGIYCDGGGTIESCTVATNMAKENAGGVCLDYGGEMWNTIVYHNMATGDPDYHNCRTNGSGRVWHSCSYPLLEGTNNQYLSPQFLDIDADDYNISEGSAALDTGVVQPWMATASDLAGEARVQGSWVNMGVYEGYEGVHVITATRTEGGTITPLGAVAVAEGGNKTFTIAATGTYEIANVLVDTVAIGATNSYTFSNVTMDHEIHAVFTDPGATNGPLGTPVWWLTSFGLTINDEQTDNDGDGHEAWEEYIADTDPTKGTSYLRITDVATLANGDHVITWTSSASRVYSLLSLTDIIAGSWTYLAGHTNLPGASPSMSRTNTSPGNVRYYRVGVSLP